MAVTAEQILDRIAELLIEHFQTVATDLGLSRIEDIQKSVDGSTGQVIVGRPDGKKAVIYQYDRKANEEDLFIRRKYRIGKINTYNTFRERKKTLQLFSQ